MIGNETCSMCNDAAGIGSQSRVVCGLIKFHPDMEVRSREVICMKKMLVALVAWVIFLSTGAALAELPASLKVDFAPVDGLVLLARDGEVLIDAAAEKGVRVGELFSVILPGEVLHHPKSGEIIGKLDKVGGVLVITEVRDNFATARQIEGPAPKIGAAVRRFDRVKAWFVDADGQSEALFAEVRSALPQLDWQPYTRDPATAGKNALHFTLRGNQFEVRGAGELLHSYTLSQATTTAVTPMASPAAVAAVAAPVAVAASIPPAAVAVLPQAAEAAQIQPSKWLGASVKGVPVALVVADLDGDNKQEIARLLADRLEIGRLVGGKYESLREIGLKRGREGVSLAAFDLNGNGRPELFLTATTSDAVRSTVYEFDGKGFQALADDQNWFINVVSLADGPALLGQRWNAGPDPFALAIHRLHWQEGKLIEGEAVHLPALATVYGITAFPAAGGDRFVRINNKGRLELCSLDTKELWVSDTSGASEVGFKYSDFSSGDLPSYFHLPGPLHLTADGLLVTAFNSGFTGSDVYRQMTSAEIVGWRWQGFDLLPQWRISKVDGYVPALTIADADNDGKDELVMLLAYPKSNPFSSRRSVIRLFAM